MRKHWDKTTGGFLIRCKRCGRFFVSRHANAQYCDLSSNDPKENGKTCKEMRRIESKRKERERGRKLQENIDAGTYVMTAMYGVISRSEYMGKFQEYLMNKYHLKNYAAFQGWISQNAELMGNEYDDFQMRTGLRRMDMDE